METTTKVLQPVNQKSVYHSAGDAYAKLMNDEISVEKAKVAEKLLTVMCTAYGLEIKRAAVENALSGISTITKIRVIELKNFENIPIEEIGNKATELDTEQKHNE